MLIHIGFHHHVESTRIVVVAPTKSAPVKRNIREAREKKLLIDSTEGRKAKSAIYTNTRQIVLTALAPETISERLQEASHPRGKT